MSFVLVILLLFLACQLFGFADAGDDVLHMIDGDGFDALLTQFVEQLGDTGFNIVDNFISTLLMSE